MADYYPLIARAIAALPQNTPEERAAIYGRARHALTRQLRSLDPPVKEEDIRAEADALEDAIGRAEAEFGPNPAPETAPPEPATHRPVAPASSSMARPEADETPAAGDVSPADAGRRAPSSAQIGPPSVSEPPPPGPPPILTPQPPVSRPAMPRMEPVRAELRPEANRGEMRAEAALSTPVVPRPPLPRPPGGEMKRPMAPLAPAESPGAVVAPAPGTPIEAGFDTALSAARTGEWPTVDADPAAARGEAEARGDLPASAPEGLAAERDDLAPRAPGRRTERPRIADESTRTQRKQVRSLGLLAGMLAVGGLAVLAFLWRDDPARYRTEETDGAAGKTEGRLASETPPLPRRADPAPVPAPVPAPAPPVVPVVPVAHRALMLEELGPGAQPRQVEGRVIWRLEDAPTEAGAAPLKMIKCVAEFPGVIGIELLIKRNTDATLPASHVVDLTFQPREGHDGVRDLTPIELRERESVPGAALSGALVPITENAFLIGLDGTELGISRNTELLRGQKWLVFEVRFTSGKRGAFLVEKGATGDRVIQEAFASWN